jgi:hypothetical protein
MKGKGEQWMGAVDGSREGAGMGAERGEDSGGGGGEGSLGELAASQVRRQAAAKEARGPGGCWKKVEREGGEEGGKRDVKRERRGE